MSKTITTVVLAVVLGAAAVVGQAAAEVWPDGRDGARLSTQASDAGARTSVLAPDDRDRVLPDRSTVSFPDFIERYVQSHRRDVARTNAPAEVSQSGEGFDWGAAGIGASTTAGLLLTIGVGIGVARRSRAHSAVA